MPPAAPPQTRYPRLQPLLKHDLDRIGQRVPHALAPEPDLLVRIPHHHPAEPPGPRLGYRRLQQRSHDQRPLLGRAPPPVPRGKLDDAQHVQALLPPVVRPVDPRARVGRDDAFVEWDGEMVIVAVAVAVAVTTVAVGAVGEQLARVNLGAG